MKKQDAQIARISYYEGVFDEICEALDTLRRAEEALRSLGPKIEELTRYYEGRLWKKDYADDEAGLLPNDLKRGILSQDGVYDLLAELDSLERT